MAKRSVKQKDHENLSDSNLRKVLGLLNSTENTITKKEACEILNISYNTTRLAKILEEFKEREEYKKTRKAQLRGKPATNQEIAEIVLAYLRGDSFDAISSFTFRSSSFIKNIIERVGVPSRKLEDESWRTEVLPEPCISESFEVGQVVWSAKYHSACIIEQEMTINYQAEQPGYSDINYEKKYSSKAYKIYVLTEEGEESTFSSRKPGFYAYALAYDLGNLQHLKDYGVNLEAL